MRETQICRGYFASEMVVDSGGMIARQARQGRWFRLMKSSWCFGIRDGVACVDFE